MSVERDLMEIIKKNNKGHPVTLIAKVETPPPNLTIKYAEQTIPSEQIYCSNYLLPHYHREYKINGVIDNIDLNISDYSFNNTTNTEVAANHNHPIKNLKGSGKLKGNGAYQSHKDLWFEDTLKAGDEVLVNIVGVNWIIVSKITKMPSGAIEGV